jgi:hypothetical protein
MDHTLTLTGRKLNPSSIKKTTTLTQEQLHLWLTKDSKMKKRSLMPEFCKTGEQLAWLYINEARTLILIEGC